tara:strand:+ start:183 stop:608 length:426 start_codon:yes stop_codon:yes gene_type:complete
MKNLTLLILSVFLLSCSSDNNEDAVTKEDNFLEVYNGVIWKTTSLSNPDDNQWFVFSPKSMVVYENESGCTKFTDLWGVANGEGETKTVLENSKNVLKIEIESGGNSFIYTLTVSENGNVLTSKNSMGTKETSNKVSEPCK